MTVSLLSKRSTVQFSYHWHVCYTQGILCKHDRNKGGKRIGKNMNSYHGMTWGLSTLIWWPASFNGFNRGCSTFKDTWAHGTKSMWNHVIGNRVLHNYQASWKCFQLVGFSSFKKSSRSADDLFWAQIIQKVEACSAAITRISTKNRLYSTQMLISRWSDKESILGIVWNGLTVVFSAGLQDLYRRCAYFTCFWLVVALANYVGCSMRFLVIQSVFFGETQVA